MWRVKIEDLKPTQVRKFDTSPKLLGQNDILFETLDLGPLLVANCRPEFQGIWSEGSPCSLMGHVLAVWGASVTTLTFHSGY